MMFSAGMKCTYIIQELAFQLDYLIANMTSFILTVLIGILNHM